jgi:nitrate reductase gamma subunit
VIDKIEYSASEEILIRRTRKSAKMVASGSSQRLKLLLLLLLVTTGLAAKAANVSDSTSVAALSLDDIEERLQVSPQ